MEAFMTFDSVEAINSINTGYSDADDEEDEYEESYPSGSHQDHTYCRPPENAPDTSGWKMIRCEVPSCKLKAGANGLASDPNQKQEKQSSVEKPVRPPLVYVRNDKAWKFQKEIVVATCGEDGQFFYHPDPFSPAPPFKGAPSALKRMEYAAKRIDNRKYRYLLLNSLI
ncbi:hypothetical protein Y032_0017g3326 [Ancylostoma ceylanicum]|nr:hypothetical protein Y032_0017g3326 [Ancylostoma ceylanicum]